MRLNKFQKLIWKVKVHNYFRYCRSFNCQHYFPSKIREGLTLKNCCYLTENRSACPFPYFSLFLCLSDCLSVCLSVSLSLFLSHYLYLNLSIVVTLSLITKETSSSNESIIILTLSVPTNRSGKVKKTNLLLFERAKLETSESASFQKFFQTKNKNGAWRILEATRFSNLRLQLGGRRALLLAHDLLPRGWKRL